MTTFKKFYLSAKDTTQVYNNETKRFNTIYKDSADGAPYVITKGKKEYLTAENTYRQK